jgi:DNA-binding Lrp family transcriptional regulator
MTKLATKVGSHPERVADRLKKLEKMGVIIQYRIGINLKMLGREHYKAILHMERYSSEDGKKLLEYISGITSAQYLIRNIGDIEPEVVVEDYHEYRQFVEKLKENFPFVIKNVESVLMKTDEWTPGYKNLLGKK